MLTCRPDSMTSRALPWKTSWAGVRGWEFVWSVMRSHRWFQLPCGKQAVCSEWGGKEATSGTTTVDWWEMAVAWSGHACQPTQISPRFPRDSVSKLFFQLHVVKTQKQILPNKIQLNHIRVLFSRPCESWESQQNDRATHPLWGVLESLIAWGLGKKMGLN